MPRHWRNAINVIRQKGTETRKNASHSIKLWLENLDFLGFWLMCPRFMIFFYNLPAWIYSSAPSIKLKQSFNSLLGKLISACEVLLVFSSNFIIRFRSFDWMGQFRDEKKPWRIHGKFSSRQQKRNKKFDPEVRRRSSTRKIEISLAGWRQSILKSEQSHRHFECRVSTTISE